MRRRKRYTVHYGDAEDPEILASLPLADVVSVVITVCDQPANRDLLQEAGSDPVLLPCADAAEEAVDGLLPVEAAAPGR